jgi:hypothetical protein
VAHCRSRPWEPEKFSSRLEQDENLDNCFNVFVPTKRVQTSTGFSGIEVYMNLFMARNLSLRIQAYMKQYNKAIHQCRRRRVAAWQLKCLAAW